MLIWYEHFNVCSEVKDSLVCSPWGVRSRIASVYLLFQVAGEIKAVKVGLKKKRSLLQMDELKCRKRVLRRLGYATASDVIELKGRVACEISR